MGMMWVSDLTIGCHYLFVDTCEEPADVIFLLDGSGSICPGLSVPDTCEDWDRALKFVSDIVLNLEGEMGGDDVSSSVRVGVVQFGDDAVVEIPLDNDMEKDDMIAFIADIAVSTCRAYNNQ